MVLPLLSAVGAFLTDRNQTGDLILLGFLGLVEFLAFVYLTAYIVSAAWHDATK